MSEIWKTYKNGYYEISNLGKVRNTETGKLLSGSIQNNGYKIFHLRKENNEHQLCHRLVAMTFIPNSENKEQVNHINGNKLDNRVKNLEWTTAQENMTHSFKMGLQPKGQKEIYCFTLNGDFINKYESGADISKNTQYRGDTILKVCKNSHIAYNLWWTYSPTFDRKYSIKAINKETKEEFLFYTAKECSKIVGVSEGTISTCANSKRQHSKYEFIKMKI